MLEGDRPLNAAAFAIHSELHRARHDVNAVAHAHTVYGRAWSATGRLIEPTSQDACAFYGDHAVFDDYTGAVYEAEEASRYATALGSGKALLLKHHGLLTVGETVDEATFWLAYRADRTAAWHQGMFELQVCMAMHFADMDEQGKPLPWYVERWTERIFLRHPLLFTDRLLSNVEAQFLEQTFGGTVPLAGL